MDISRLSLALLARPQLPREGRGCREKHRSLSKAQICPGSPVAGGMACQAAKPIPLLQLPTEREGVS